MANIEISASKWDAISDNEREQISEHLKKYKLLLDGDRIEGSPNISAPENEFSLDDLNPLKGACQGLCDIAAATAIGALTLSGPALAVAVLAIDAARQECRNRC